MYGQIHCVVKEMVLEQFGESTWKDVLKKCDMDNDSHFLVFTYYQDSVTFGLLAAVCDVSKLPREAVLKRFGAHFLTYCLRHGYDKMLKSLGSDIYAFIENLDSLHSLLSITYTGIMSPSFRCDKDENDDMLLHYYSRKEGFYPVVIGLVEAVSTTLFNQAAKVTVISQTEERIGDSHVFHHVIFRVALVSSAQGTKISTALAPTAFLREASTIDPDQPSVIRAGDICRALPYHLVFDEQMRIQQCGDNIRRITRIVVKVNMPFSSVGQVVQPVIHQCIPDILSFINAVFVVAIFSNPEDKSRSFLLRGQMIWMQHSRLMLFVGSPRLTSLDEMLESKVFLCDIPLYDATRELVLLNQQRIAEIDVAKVLDKTTAALYKTSMELRGEQKKTEDLLHMMLPKNVANCLTQGIPVEAEQFRSCTIFFSDIVTFTGIASACRPMDVINMLNQLYNRFDTFASKHAVYKVETIGDAYMCVGGVPEVQEDHAERIADFSMDTLEAASNVMSPATHQPLQIRVGLHSGPVVAGVVGKKMPRYCLFGDTVNTASRMESHSRPNRIHLSDATYSLLYRYGYIMKKRGEMTVKGKGQMVTYFLVGKLDHRVREPEDSFNSLPITVCPKPIIRERPVRINKFPSQTRRSFNFLKMSFVESSSSEEEDEEEGEEEEGGEEREGDGQESWSSQEDTGGTDVDTGKTPEKSDELSNHKKSCLKARRCTVL